MKKIYFLMALMISFTSFGQDLIITGAYDGPLTGGTPKGVELYVVNDIADLSIYGIGSANNGGGTDGVEFTFPADAVTAGTFIYVASEAVQFANFFGFPPTYNAGAAMGINGDDAVELFEVAGPTVIDVFGDINTDGTGQAWDHLDGWGYRVDGSGPDGSAFDLLNWFFSGTNVFDGQTTNATSPTPFPIGTYSTTASTTPTINVGGAVTGLDYFENNGPSSEGTFTVSGINLTDDITVVAPANFEISLTTATGFSNAVLLAQAGGTVSTTDVFVRLAGGLVAGPYSGDATASTAGATNATVALSGTVSPDDPQISINGGVASLDYNFGSGPSAGDAFGVSGLFLTTDITVTAPTNFEVSLAETTGYGPSVIVPQAGGTASNTTVYARLAGGLAEGPYAGDITAASAGAPDQILSVSGNVFPAATCANVGDIIFTEVMQNPSVNGDPAGEYFELYNTTVNPIDLVGWDIKDDLSVGETHTITTSLIIPGNGYIVIANAAVPNGGLTPDYTYANDISLGNGTDGLILECSSTIIDQVIWDNGATFPDPSGASIELSINALTSVNNDFGVNWATATTPFGDGDLGTPGGVNGNTLSINELNTSAFNVFPNPTSTGFVNITSRSSEAIAVQVFDILGKQVISETLNNNRLNVANLNTGLYVMRISQNNNTVTKKLVIK